VFYSTNELNKLTLQSLWNQAKETERITFCVKENGINFLIPYKGTFPTVFLQVLT
jgi:hypothetical protein